MTYRSMVLTAALVFSACATVARVYDFDNSFEFAAGEDDVWPAVIDVFGERGWPITNMERASGFISTDWMLASTRIMDCGSDGLLTSLRDPQVRFNVVVRGTAADDVTVTVNATMRARRIAPGALDGVLIECNSRGVVEAEIDAALRTAVGGVYS